jgi:hypothetical protein
VSDHIDLRGQLGPVRDQGRRGTCLSFAATACHEQARRRRRGALPAELGEEILYWACKQIDGDTAAGSYPRSAAQALTDTGQSAGALWPYDGARDDTAAAYTPPSEALAAANMRRGTLRSVAREIDEIRELLRRAHALMMALELWRGFYAAHEGALELPAQADLLGVGHAVAVVGFDDDAQELLLRNSWGQTWGDGGYGRLPYAALRVVCRGVWRLEDDLDV